MWGVIVEERQLIFKKSDSVSLESWASLVDL